MRQLVTVQSNLKAWLTPLAQRAGPVTPPNPREKLEAAWKRAGIKMWPQNGLRHGYAPYHLGKYQDAAALALQIGHTTTAILFMHYRELVTPEAAKAYWRVERNKSTPEATCYTVAQSESRRSLPY